MLNVPCNVLLLKMDKPTKKLLLIMNFTAIILLMACLTVSAGGYTQKVTLNEKNITLQKVFKEIHKQTGFQFFYKDELLKQAGKVDIAVTDAPLEQVLEICFKNLPITYSIVDKAIVVKEKEQSDIFQENKEIAPQPIDVKGRVVNEKGEPVIASVQIKGTSKGTSTNANGEFELKGVDENTTLVITGVNIETIQIKVAGKTDLATINAKTKITEGDEVIINTGYQTIPKERATGSFVVIDNKTLNQQVGTNILQRLDGVTSGLLFNVGKQNNNSQNKTGISIRGLSTILGPLDPLVVVNGFIYEGNISNINPNDVEDITILKDAAATSIWGARAGNGVIVINMKRGKFNQKVQVDVNANIIVNSKPDLASLPQMSSSDYIDVEAFLFNKGFFNSAINSKYQALTPATEVFLKRRNGLINSVDSGTLINALKQIDSRNQYNKYVYKNAVTQQYAVNLRGGTELNAYTFSVGFDKNLGELHNQSNKINIKVENIFRPTKNLQLTIQAYYTNEQGSSGLSGYNTLRINGRQVPYLQLVDNSGNQVSMPITFRDLYTDTAGAGKLLSWKYYPLTDYHHSQIDTRLLELYTNVGLRYKLGRYLDFDIKYQYQKQDIETEQLNDIESYYTRSTINLYSQINRSTGIVKYNIPLGGILARDNSTIASHTSRAQLNFNKTWGQHEISAIFGGEIRQAVTKSDNATTYGYYEDPLKYANMDFINSYPTFITGSSQKIPGPPSFSWVINRFVSTYANGAYTFRNRYTVSASGRRDGSNLFGASTNDKWKPLWSTGAAWKISNERFYSSALIPLLKLKATYGYSGNVDLSRSAVAVGSYTTSSNNLPAVQINSINNPSLRWEKIGMLNVGIEFELKRRILYGSIEFFHKKGTDLYGRSPYDYTTWGGSSEIIINSANIKGTGVDVILNTKIINTAFKWDTRLLFNYNRDKTTKYQSATALGAQGVLSIVGGGGILIRPVVGKPLYAIAAYKWGGLDSLGNPRGILNGQLSTNYSAIFQEGGSKGVDGNIKYIGTANPIIYGSLLNSFSFKQLTISVSLTYKFGYYFRKPVISYSQLVSSGNGHSDFTKRWQRPGDELITSVPSFIYPNNTNRDGFYSLSEINVLKADQIRFQYINLSYSPGKPNSKRSLWKKNIQVYANAANLGIIWRANKENLDPDFALGLPPQKTWAIGVRASF